MAPSTFGGHPELLPAKSPKVLEGEKDARELGIRCVWMKERGFELKTPGGSTVLDPRAYLQATAENAHNLPHGRRPCTLLLARVRDGGGPHPPQRAPDAPEPERLRDVKSDWTRPPAGKIRERPLG